MNTSLIRHRSCLPTYPCVALQFFSHFAWKWQKHLCMFWAATAYIFSLHYISNSWPLIPPIQGSLHSATRVRCWKHTVHPHGSGLKHVLHTFSQKWNFRWPLWQLPLQQAFSVHEVVKQTPLSGVVVALISLPHLHLDGKENMNLNESSVVCHFKKCKMNLMSVMHASGHF